MTSPSPARHARSAALAFAVAAGGSVSCVNADTIVVQVQPTATTVMLNDSFTIEFRAQIPDSCPIVGWGMDALYDSSMLTPGGLPAINPFFLPVPSGDGDGLAGLVAPPNAPVSGPDILLATMTFTANSLGVTEVIGSYTPSDPLEGFVMVGGGFAPVEFEGGIITVVPAPSTLLALAALGCLRSGRNRRTTPLQIGRCHRHLQILGIPGVSRFSESSDKYRIG